MKPKRPRKVTEDKMRRAARAAEIGRADRHDPWHRMTVEPTPKVRKVLKRS